VTSLSSALAGVPVAVFGVGAGCGSDLALGLADLGAPLALLCNADQAEEAEAAKRTAAQAISGGGSATVVPFDPTSAASITDAIAKAAAEIGDVRAVVDIANPGPAASPTPVSGVDEGGWDERVTQPLAYALHRLQGAYRTLRTSGGRIVVVLPTLSMSGAAGLVPWTTVSEGQRALAKVAARAWGGENITVNCLGVPADLLTATGPATGLDRPGLPDASLGRLPDARSDVARAVAGLLGDGMPFVTGATVAVDGGVWMTP
jgi:NAD(P)-dependent dehydrogenase (short-subunit alcohol dehydrogenase family)